MECHGAGEDFAKWGDIAKFRKGFAYYCYVSF
jgi:hypothetical protein